MSISFKKFQTPLEIVKRTFDEISQNSGGEVIFNYTQRNDNNYIYANSLKQVDIRYDVTVRNSKNLKFRLYLLTIKQGLMPYPVEIQIIDDILKSYSRNNAIDYFVKIINDETELIAFLNELINDNDFAKILNSIYNL